MQPWLYFPPGTFPEMLERIGQMHESRRTCRNKARKVREKQPRRRKPPAKDETTGSADENGTVEEMFVFRVFS